MTSPTINRESWLTGATELLRPDFESVGFALPARLAVSCGWPSSGGTATKRRTIGQCWAAEASAGGAHEVFVSPVIDDPVEVLAVLVHELVHTLPSAVGHGSSFRKPALAMGLTGKMTATTAGDDLAERLGYLTEILGTYPHKRITATGKEKVQTTRMLKVECEDCGCVVRMTRKWLDECGAPSCACNGEPMAEAA